MASWDRRTTKQLGRQQDAAVRAQVVDAVAPFSPWWRDRLRALGRRPATLSDAAALETLPAVGERDVCPDGDPAGAAGLVLQAGEVGYALHAEGPRLRSALLRRLVRPSSYRTVVEGDTRPTSFVWAGLSMRFPVASTRSDLDVVARAGARLWQVLGLSRADVVVSALPVRATATAQALQLGALGAASPLLSPGARPERVAEALRLVPATVLVVPVESAVELLGLLAAAGAPLATLRTLVLSGAPYDDERAAVRTALADAGVPVECAVLAVHVPDGHRLLWGECRPSEGRTGLHTYPDLELLQTVDPESGEAAPRGTGELVLTQLGLRGTALLRWRTGDLVDGLATDACPDCGRTVPRAVGLRPAALVPRVGLRTGAVDLDVRPVTAALAGRADVEDWCVELARSARDSTDQLLVHVAPAAGADESDVATGVAEAVRAGAGLLPTQVVVTDRRSLPTGDGPLSPRVLLRG